MKKFPISVSFCQFNPRCSGESVIPLKWVKSLLSYLHCWYWESTEGNCKLIIFFWLVKLPFSLLKMMMNFCVWLLQLQTAWLHLEDRSCLSTEQSYRSYHWSYRDNPAAPTAHTQPQMLPASQLIKIQPLQLLRKILTFWNVFGFQNRMKMHKQTVIHNYSVWMCSAVLLQYHANIELGIQLILQQKRKNNPWFLS